jgi:pteridine reductase
MPATSPVVLVTGAARRIGAAIARHLHTCGYQVILHYRHSRAEAESLASALQEARADSACALAADLARPEECARLIDQTVRWRGRLDAVVNNASSFFRTPLAEVNERAWAELIDGNLKAAFFVSRHAAPWLRASGGAIVNLCDVHTERPLPGFSVYTAAKAGMVSLTRSLALELAPRVRVNAVSPGSLTWPEDDTFSAGEQTAAEAAIPLARIGTGEDIARAVHFLLAGNDYITGHVLHVDGGASLVSH